MTHANPRPRATPTNLATAVLAALMLLAGGAAAQDDGASAPTLAEVLRDTPELSEFAELVEHGRLSDDLARPLRLTILAPSNDAFARLPEAQREVLTRNPGALNHVLRHHVAIGNAPLDALARLDALTTLQTTRLPIGRSGDRVRIDGATVIQGDLRASNGVVHVIDRVLVPGSTTSIKNVLSRPER